MCAARGEVECVCRGKGTQRSVPGRARREAERGRERMAAHTVLAEGKVKRREIVGSSEGKTLVLRMKRGRGSEGGRRFTDAVGRKR